MDGQQLERSDALRADRHAGEHQHRGGDVMERQRQDRHRIARLDRLRHAGLELPGIGNEVAVRQHRALRQAGGAAGVLQERHVVAGERDGIERGRGTFGARQTRRRSRPLRIQRPARRRRRRLRFCPTGRALARAPPAVPEIDAVVEQNPLGSAVKIVVLPAPQRPQEGGQARRPQGESDRDQEQEIRHPGPPCRAGPGQARPACRAAWR